MTKLNEQDVPGPTESLAAEYCREQLAKDMQPFYEAFGVDPVDPLKVATHAESRITD